MIMRVEIQQAIKVEREREALELIRELNRNGLDYPSDDLTWAGLSLQGDFREPEATGCYRDHLRVLSQLGPLSDAPARIRIYLTG